jgi:hypothetical protein
MVSNVYGTNRIISNTSTTDSYSYIDMNKSFAGCIRYNSRTCLLEIYDGMYWLQYNRIVTVSLDAESVELLEYVKQLKNREQDLEKKSKNNPTLAILLEQKKQLEEQIKITEILIK